MGEKISIIMATYNGEKFLREQLNSILNQTYNNFELIICDDCSKDNTWEILKEYNNKDNRIIIYKNQENIGFIKNFYKLISLCTNEYIAFSDQDDIWTPNHLEVLINSIGNYDLSCSNSELIDELGNSLNYTMLDTFNIEFIPKNKEENLIHLLYKNYIQGSTMLIKRELANKVLQQKNEKTYHDHWIALFAAISNGIKYNSEILLYYRQHNMNVTENKKFNIINKIKQCLRINTRNVHKKNSDNIAKLLKYKDLSDNDKKIIKEAYIFEKRLGTFSKRIMAIPYFIKNYKLLFLSKSKRLFLLRFIKIFIFLN